MRPLFLLLALAACAPTNYQRGSIQPETSWEALQTGMSKDELLRRFGSPSSQSAFGEETWYYVQTFKESRAFLKPEITDQKVIAVRFSPDDTVKDVQQFGLNDRQDVAMIEEKTRTEGHSIGFLEQALGNLGRFNSTGGREIDPRGPAGRR